MIHGRRKMLATAPLLWPGAAFAHAPIAGVNSFYNGLLHPLFVPVHVLLLAALGLLFGQQGAVKNAWILLVYLGAVVLGLCVAPFSPGPDLEPILLVVAGALGLLLGVSPPLPAPWLTVIGVLSGFLVGLDSFQSGLAFKNAVLGLFGSGISLYLLPLYPMGLVETFSKRSWQRIGVRVLGSWIAASALLVLSLSLARS